MHLTYAGADQADRPWAVHVLQGPVEQSGLLHRPHLLRLGHSQGLQRRHRPPYYYGRTYYGCGHVTMGVLTGYYGCTFFSCSHCGRTYHGRSLVVLTIPTTLWPCRVYQAPSSRYGSSECCGHCAQSSGSRACASWSCRYSSRCPCCLTSWCHYKYK